ncbi:hypothetical protein H4582DRAFT_1903779 [Lactarius indigo]|nr:hypothetical protein H4582DRAFT_1903779 [Lactarius indigo]
MFSPLLAFSSYLLFIGTARAQVSAPPCTDTSFTWRIVLEVLSTFAVFAITSLQPQHYYTGPSGADNDDLCKCNMVVYNLISACDACQGAPWIPYSTWSFNCTTKAPAGTFPEPVPIGTTVPNWAYIDRSISDSWNATEAQLAGDAPEVTGTSPIVPTSTIRGSQSTLTPTTSGSGSSSTSTSHSSSNAGAIAGGVVGGIVGAALIIGVAAVVLHSPSTRSLCTINHLYDWTRGRDGAARALPADHRNAKTLPPPATYSPIGHTYSGLPEV